MKSNRSIQRKVPIKNKSFLEAWSYCLYLFGHLPKQLQGENTVLFSLITEMWGPSNVNKKEFRRVDKTNESNRVEKNPQCTPITASKPIKISHMLSFPNY